MRSATYSCHVSDQIGDRTALPTHENQSGIGIGSRHENQSGIGIGSRHENQSGIGCRRPENASSYIGDVFRTVIT